MKNTLIFYKKIFGNCMDWGKHNNGKFLKKLIFQDFQNEGHRHFLNEIVW